MKRILLALMLLFSFASAIPVAAATPPGIPAGAVRLQALEIDQIYVLLNNKCMDADTSTIHGNGTKIQVWDCNQYLQQRFYLNWGQTTAYQNVFSGRCLDVNPSIAGQNGARLQLWDCNGSNQQGWWYVTGDSSIHSALNGKCLDVNPAQANTNGTKIQLWDCNGAIQQRWHYRLWQTPGK